jgi:hypothetical protein
MPKPSIRPFMMVFNTEGVDQKSGVFLTQPKRADWIENMHTNQLGVFSADQQGYSLFLENVTTGSPIDGLSYFQVTGAQPALLLAANGHIRQFAMDGEEQALLTTALLSHEPVDFESFQGVLFVTQKGASSLKWPGYGLMEAVSGFPIVVGALSYDKPRLVERHVNRLVYADFSGTVSYPSHIAISDDLDPETFTIGLDDTNAAVIQISPGDGQHITGMKSLHLPSTNKTSLLVFKETSVFVVNGDTPQTFTVELINGTVGALNNRCIVQLGNDIIFMDRHRISSLSAANESGTLRFKPLSSDRIQNVLQELNLNAAEQCFAVHLPSRQEVWFGLPTGSSQKVNKILVYRYPLATDEPGAWSIRTGIEANVPLLTPDDKFLLGNYSGDVYQFFGDSTYAGEPMSWRYRFPFHHFDVPLQSKRIVDCFAWFLSPTPQSITFRSEWRGGGAHSVTTVTKTISPYRGATYGTTVPPAATYGANFYNDIPLMKVRVPVRGNGEQLRLEISGETSATGGPIFIGFTGLVEYMNDSRSFL